MHHRRPATRACQAIRGAVFLLSWAVAAARAFGQAPGERALSDWLRVSPPRNTQQWGSLGYDSGVVPPGAAAGTPIRIGEAVYAKGIGHHAAGELIAAIPPGALRFRAEVGILWQGGNRGSAVAAAAIDGRTLFESPVLSDSSAPVPVDIPVEGAREIRLTAGDAGDGISCDCIVWANARFLVDPNAPALGAAEFAAGDTPGQRSLAHSGLSLVTFANGPQILFDDGEGAVTVVAYAGEQALLRIPVLSGPESLALRFRAEALAPAGEAAIDVSGRTMTVRAGAPAAEPVCTVSGPDGARGFTVAIRSTAGIPVRLTDFGLETDGGFTPVRLRLADADPPRAPPGSAGPLRPETENLLVEWDWRLQDGIGHARIPGRFDEAIERSFACMEALAADLDRRGIPPDYRIEAERNRLRREWAATSGETRGAGGPAEALWRRVRRVRRDMLLSMPEARVGPVAFAKRVPSSFSHQLTQYYGRYARPGGGVFVLEEPGVSMRTRDLLGGALGAGSVQHLDVSAASSRILFAFCEAPTAPDDSLRGVPGRYYHLYEVRPDGTGLRQLTDGEADDFAPRELPDGRIVFTSTRRGGWHRCGSPGCETYVLTVAEADGSSPRPISRHETNEWDPAVLPDGRILFTRWDYVDRNAVHYQHLWTIRPDGTGIAGFYGNATFNPVGIWEARPVPGSHRIMATAGAHHAMTAGSIVLIDVRQGDNGIEPLTRLTPDVPFPESESLLRPHWRSPGGAGDGRPEPIEEQRWPGHCYRSAYPLSEDLFLVAYSYDPLVGEPAANPPNQFGLYLADRFGNRELLYRDLNVSSLWPVPLTARTRPLRLPGGDTAGDAFGTFLVQDVRRGDLPLPEGTEIRAIRILQVLPKSTPGANNPPIGLPNASPGKQVLGTVPVAADGSAYFKVPADTPVAFQLLDGEGQAVRIMRSDVWVRRGEAAGCIGCHEPRATAPPPGLTPLAATAPPAVPEPGPDGSRPLSYPILVQPVLDRHCLKCHAGDKPKGRVRLTGEAAGPYTVSYEALAPLAAYTAWGLPGDFRETNSEPITRPDAFGARAAPLMRLLREGHHKVSLPPEDEARLITWMDTNALFYGSFDPADQLRQQRGERIDGPALE